MFGAHAPPPALANTLLKTLQSRRVNGTLDLDLPNKLSRQLKAYPSAVDDALAWLRQGYPLDEDAAIMRRIEREDAGYGNEELIARAESLGLYKPQSGTYDAKLGEGGDIYGESALDNLRKAHEQKAEKEEEELDEYIRKKQEAAQEEFWQKQKQQAAEGGKVGALAVTQENAVEGR